MTTDLPTVTAPVSPDAGFSANLSAERDLLSLSSNELRDVFLSLGQPAYRVGQLQKWLTAGCRDFSEMKNLPQSLRSELSARFPLHTPQVLRRQQSREDGTVKLLWGLRDGNSVETVLMRYRYGNSVCISSQVGCRQGCAFCASTIGGLVRSLTAGEMLDEVLFTEKETGLSVSNVVLMGIGEPLDNLENVLRFLRLLSAPEGRNLGLRHITVSTCGIPEGIDVLAESGLPVTLTLSLHAPDDETRSRIMPSSRGVRPVLDACRRYWKKTGRRVSFEYAMIAGVNDGPDQARLLAAHAKYVGAHVNLIPLNRVEERTLPPASHGSIRRFQSLLTEQGVNVTVRRSLGGDIDAACGQLRRKELRTRA